MYNGLVLSRFSSVALYLLVFIGTLIFTYVLEVSLHKKHIQSLLYFTIIIFILCCFSAIRGTNVGTDYEIYGIEIFDLGSEYKSILSIFSSNTRFEKIYIIMAYFVHLITNKRQVYMFLIQFLCTFPVLFGLCKLKENISITLAMLYYLFVLYPMSFNVMRQSASISILFLGSVYLLQKKYIKFIVLSIISVLFHATSTMAIAFLLLSYGIFSFRNFYARKIIYIFCLLFVFFIAFSWYDIAYIATSIGILPKVVYSAIDIFLVGKNHTFTTININGYFDYIFRSSIFVFILLFKNRYKTSELFKFVFITNVIDFLLYSIFFFMLNTIYGYRIIMIFDYLNMILFSILVGKCEKAKFDGKILPRGIILSLMSCSYFIIYYGLYGSHQIIHYSIFS